MSIRVVQLIDSLEAGGAERMAVNYANVLQDEIAFSGLIVTRKEGDLKLQLKPTVSYVFLDKKKALDFKALVRLRKYIVSNEITHIHAHSSSFFLAVLVKITLLKVKIIWHDHYGNSAFLYKRPFRIVQVASLFFNSIISVNQRLKNWSLEKLFCKKVLFLPNFVHFESSENQETNLKGIDGKRILCLANLRPQKNHQLLLSVAKLLQEDFPEWTFHLVGKDFNDAYSAQIKKTIAVNDLSENVFIYDSCKDIEHIMNQSEIGILSSQSEGLPVSILEYGYYSKAVITTNVGQISAVIKSNENGILIETQNAQDFYMELKNLLENAELRLYLSTNLKNTITNNFEASKVLQNYLNFIK